MAYGILSFPGGSAVKNLPAIRSPGREEPWEKEMANCSSTLAWEIPWTEEPGGLYSPLGHKESDTTERLRLPLSTCFNF